MSFTILRSRIEGLGLTPEARGSLLVTLSALEKLGMDAKEAEARIDGTLKLKGGKK